MRSGCSRVSPEVNRQKKEVGGFQQTPSGELDSGNSNRSRKDQEGKPAQFQAPPKKIRVFSVPKKQEACKSMSPQVASKKKKNGGGLWVLMAELVLG